MPIFNMVGGGGSSVLTGDAAVGEVLASKTFYANDPASKLTGTMVNRGEVDTDITAVAQSVTIAQGYHNGSGTVQIAAADQAKLIAGNIKSGVTVLGVAGSVTSGTDTSDATAAESDILDGKTAYVDGEKLTGTCTYYADLKNMIERGEDFTSLTIPDGVTSIGPTAFSECDSLTSIIIPGSVTSIVEGPFTENTNLTSVTILDGVTEIDGFAFLGCTSLASVTIPGSVTSIGAAAFCECDSLTSVTVPGSVTSIEEDAFYSVYLVNVTIGSTGHAVSGIDAGAFDGDSGTGTLTVYTVDGNALANSPYGWMGTVVHTTA